MNLESIATYLEEQGHGTVGVSIFVNKLPSQVQEGVLLLPPYGGAPINHYLPGYHNAEFRLVTRSPDYDRARVLAEACSAALKQTSNMSMGDLLVTQCLPANLPRPYRPSTGGYVEMEVEFDIWFSQQVV